jgi:hypothetical protein
METPETIKPHQPDYVEGAWQDYTFAELGQWIHLLATRATHRGEGMKRQKDLYDAQNYLNMLQAKLNALFPHVPRVRP